jgi:hypothetical protein
MTKVKTKSAAIQLSDAQLTMMAGAAQRQDRCLAPTDVLKGGARRTAGRKLTEAVDKLMEAGLVREVRTKSDMPVSRRDEETGLEFSWKLTVAGARVASVHDDDEKAGNSNGSTGGKETALAGVRETEAPSSGASTKAESPQTSSVAAAASLVASADPVMPNAPTVVSSEASRPGTKIAEVLALLARSKGASINELMGATGWLPHTTRAALTGLRQRGYAIERSRENATTRYVVMNNPVQGSSAGSNDQCDLEADESNQRRAARRSERLKTPGKQKRTSAVAGSPGAA